MLRIIIRARADRDIRRARRWYDEQGDALGSSFIGAIDQELTRVRHFPAAYPFIHARRGIRRAIVQGYPYSIYYVVGRVSIEVLMVRHNARREPRFDRRA